ncbi:MAG: indole-3-glycerol phosphate synthase TrpC [Pseudomonadota bacterium]
MSDFLATMAESSSARAQAAEQVRGFADLMMAAESMSQGPRLALSTEFDVIAEIKANSPAEGALADQATLDRAVQASDYASGGACAVSVLTEPDRFAGTLEHLVLVAKTLAPMNVPAMRKDFLVNEYQIVEARVAGAGGVLLIVAMLDNARLTNMLARARQLGLFVLLECFDRDDLARACALLDSSTVAEMISDGRFMLGINTRNLRSLAVDSDRLRSLAPQLPDGVVCVAESGLKTPEDVGLVVEWGYRAALIGTALMKSASPARLVREFVAAGRDR